MNVKLDGRLTFSTSLGILLLKVSLRNWKERFQRTRFSDKEHTMLHVCSIREQWASFPCWAALRTTGAQLGRAPGTRRSPEIVE